MIGNNSHKSQTTRKRKMKIKQPQMKGIDFFGIYLLTNYLSSIRDPRMPVIIKRFPKVRIIFLIIARDVIKGQGRPMNARRAFDLRLTDDMKEQPKDVSAFITIKFPLLRIYTRKMRMKM